MNLIRDIRLYEQDAIYHYKHKDFTAVIQRLLFLLRNRGFGFEDFDHLYVNFTPCLPHGEVRDVNRDTIREFAWLHYVDVGCEVELFNSWDLAEKTAFILESVKKAALLKAPADQWQLFSDTFDEVLEKGESLLIPYRQKENENYRVEIFVRINDELDFLPLVRVTDREEAVVAEQALRSYGRDEFISQIGTITIGKRSVRIVPRKNWDADYYDLKPIKITW